MFDENNKNDYDQQILLGEIPKIKTREIYSEMICDLLNEENIDRRVFAKLISDYFDLMKNDTRMLIYEIKKNTGKDFRHNTLNYYNKLYKRIFKIGLSVSEPYRMWVVVGSKRNYKFFVKSLNEGKSFSDTLVEHYRQTGRLKQPKKIVRCPTCGHLLD